MKISIERAEEIGDMTEAEAKEKGVTADEFRQVIRYLVTSNPLADKIVQSRIYWKEQERSKTAGIIHNFIGPKRPY